MRVESVTLTAFGPFEGATLDLRPGLNVVCGPNEAGKSTWHAGICAALCGVSRHSPRPMDLEFAERHRPWDRPGWAVSAVVSLEDGRRLEIVQDLAGDGPSHVREIDGADLTEFLMFEGAPDASRLLGFNRRTFRATACVDQADVFGLLEDPGILRVQLQRAAATAGADASASTARERLAALAAAAQDGLAFERDRRPALDERLRAARSATREHLESLAAVQELEARESALAQEHHALETALAVRAADESSARTTRIQELLERYPERPEGDLARDEKLAQEVAAAVRAFEDRPEPQKLTGPTLADLEAELASLPEAHLEGDIEPQPEVLAARDSYDSAKRELDDNWTRRPPEPEPVTASASEEALRDLADRLEAELDGASGPSTGRARRLSGRLFRTRSRRHGPPAEKQAAQLGLPPNPAALRDAADQVARAAEARRELQLWATRQQELRAQVAASERILRESLTEAGVEIEGSLVEAVFVYIRQCGERAQEARSEARRRELLGMIGQRRTLEESAARIQEARRQAEAGLRDAAARVGVEAGQPLALMAALQEWLGRLGEERDARRAAAEAWRELDVLTGGTAVDELQSAAAMQRRRALELASAGGADALVEVDLGGDPEARLDGLREGLDAVRQELNLARGRLEAVGPAVASVAEAEEDLAASDARAARLREVAAAASEAHDRVAAAQERVHQSIAPALAAAVREWLPRITDGRYVDAWVQPETLQVDVCGADRMWRQAALLSQGTAEQIYLLLRLAMVERLTEPGEKSPALLDDVTVQSDTPRTMAMLDLLHDLSRDRQVLLFSQEEEVRQWAERSLDGETDRLHVLEPLAMPAPRQAGSGVEVS